MSGRGAKRRRKLRRGGARQQRSNGFGLREARLAARLESLPREELVRLVSAASVFPKSEYLCAMEAALALHAPVPEWAVTLVLLFPDIIQLILAHLDLEDCAAGAVCATWRQAWEVTRDGRRGLRVASVKPPDLHFQSKAQRVEAIVPIPDAAAMWILVRDNIDDVLLQLVLGTVVRESWNTAELNFINGPIKGIAAGKHGLYVWTDKELRRYEVDISNPSEGLLNPRNTAEWPAGFFPAYSQFGAVTTSGLLFFSPKFGEVLVLDPLTMGYSRRWGRGYLCRPSGMAQVEDEIYVVDRGISAEDEIYQLKVFSLDGEYRRMVSSPDINQLRPFHLSYHDGRLYAIERGASSVSFEEFDAAPGEWGIGICVLSPDGTLLQVYDPGLCLCMAAGVFDMKLLLYGYDQGREDGGQNGTPRRSPAVQVLCGL